MHALMQRLIAPCLGVCGFNSLTDPNKDFKRSTCRTKRGYRQLKRELGDEGVGEKIVKGENWLYEMGEGRVEDGRLYPPVHPLI